MPKDPMNLSFKSFAGSPAALGGGAKLFKGVRENEKLPPRSERFCAGASPVVI
jgi:hypothetical protein